MCHKKKGLDPESMELASSLTWGTLPGLDDVGGGWVACNSQKHPWLFGVVLTVLGRDMYKCLFTPDRTLMTAQSSDSTQVHLGKPMSFWSLKSIVEGLLTGS